MLLKIINDLKKKYFKKNILKEPIFYILSFSFILFVIGINWGLPSKYTWQIDDLAPLVPIKGLFKFFSFGYYRNYPLVHQVILAFFNIPVIITALIETLIRDGFNKGLFLELITDNIRYLTAYTFIDRFISVIMGVLIIYFIYKSSKELFNKKAGIFSAIIVVMNEQLNNHAHVSKVEVPYIFWAILALYMLIKIIKYDQKKYYIYCAIFACLSFGSKDQGFAIFILPFILFLFVYQMIFNHQKEKLIKILFRENILIFIITFIISTIAVENIIFNFEGLIKRFYILTGDNGTRSISYTLDINGIIKLFVDTNYQIINQITLPFYILCVSGMVFTFFYLILTKDYKKFVLSSIFLAASISYYIFFIQIIRQNALRFQIPIGIFIGCYGGFLLEYLYNKFFLKQKIIFTIIFALICLYPFYFTISYNVSILFDVRYNAEKWMKENIENDSIIEYYSNYSIIPRNPENTVLNRIKSNILDIEKRKPDYIVLTNRCYTKYFTYIDEDSLDELKKEGRIMSKKRMNSISKSDFKDFFILLFQNKLNYKLIKVFDFDIKYFKKHGSINYVLIYKRI